MTPDCKILFPELGEYRVAFGPTVPGIPVSVMTIDGYKETFTEYGPSYLRIADCNPEIPMHNRQWKPGYTYKPRPVVAEWVAYSDCEDLVLDPETWKRAAIAFGAAVCDISVRVLEFTRSANPYYGVLCKYEYKFKMEVHY